MRHLPRTVRYLPFTLFLFTYVSPSAQTFRARIDTVLVAVTVHDAGNRLVTGLSKDDYAVR